MNPLYLIKTWFVGPFRYWSLFRGFVQQDLRSRYIGSFGGFLWSICNPLCKLLIYIFVFSIIFQIRLKPIETGTGSFVVYLLSGLLPWLAFADAVNLAPGIIIGKARLITKVAFPVEILPAAGVTVSYLLNGIGILLLLVFLAFKGYAGWQWLWMLLLFGLQIVFSLGLVAFLGALCVFLRDIEQFLNVMMQLWFYVTPILYPPTQVPPAYRPILMINPMFPFIELYHSILLRHSIDQMLLLYALAVSVSTFWLGTYFFKRSKNAFADVL
jgi:lipopolysaccharide transport system permease protein